MGFTQNVIRFQYCQFMAMGVTAMWKPKVFLSGFNVKDEAAFSTPEFHNMTWWFGMAIFSIGLMLIAAAQSGESGMRKALQYGIIANGLGMWGTWMYNPPFQKDMSMIYGGLAQNGVNMMLAILALYVIEPKSKKD